MATKYAKWLGGALGWALGGPIGAVAGFSLGYLWDNATLDVVRADTQTREETHQGDFAISLLVLAAAVMRADDRVMKSELGFVKAFLSRQFTQDQATEYLRVLRDLLQRDIELGPVCAQIVLHMSHPQRLQLMHFLLGIANSDGHFDQREWNVITYIAKHLRVSMPDLDSMGAMYSGKEDRYYKILEINSDASEQEIKTAYRKMAKKYHPDRLGDVGDEVRAAAVEKFRQVQEAYDYLSKSKITV